MLYLGMLDFCYGLLVTRLYTFFFGNILQKKIGMESSEILTVYQRLEFFFFQNTFLHIEDL